MNQNKINLTDSPVRFEIIGILGKNNQQLLIFYRDDVKTTNRYV